MEKGQRKATREQGLKNLYFISKKNLYQNLVGKLLEVLASGIVSETDSKKLFVKGGTTFTHLIR